MGTLTITKTWSAATPTEADLDGIKNSLEKFLNETGVNTDNVASLSLNADIKNNTISSDRFADAAITRAKQAAKNIVEEGAAYVATTLTNTTFSDMSGSASITSVGRPVMIWLDSIGASGSDNYLQVETSDGASAAEIILLRDTTQIASWEFRSDSAATQLFRLPLSALRFIDVVAAGTYAYKFQCKVPNASDSIKIAGESVVVMEI